LYHIHNGVFAQLGDRGLTYGTTGPNIGGEGYNMSAIYLETIREHVHWLEEGYWGSQEYQCTQQELEARTVAHEMGHQLGYPDQGTAGTIMDVSSTTPTTAVFNEDQIKVFRTSKEIEKEPLP
jgi:hypothetical protein